MKTTVTERRQTSIPADICRQAGIEPGWFLEWSLRDGELAVKPVPPPDVAAKRIRQRARSWKIDRRRLGKKIAEERRREERNERREGRR